VRGPGARWPAGRPTLPAPGPVQRASAPRPGPQGGQTPRLGPVSVHGRIERGFERWGRFVCHHARATTAAALLLTLALGSFLPRLEGDFSTESYLREDDPALLAYDRFREQFGREDRILIGISPDNVFDLDFLARLRALHRALEREVPYVSEVTSLINARWTRGEEDALVVEDLLAEPPADATALAALRARVFSNPLYPNTLISKDASFTVLSVEPFTYTASGAAGDDLGGFEAAPPGAESEEAGYLTVLEGLELVAALDEVTARYDAPGFPVYVLGSLVLGARLRAASERDAGLFVATSIATIGLVMFALFRRLSGVVLPLLVILLSLVATFGSMAALGIPFSMVTQILPTFLIAIGICDAVHILTIVYRRLGLGHSAEAAVVHALRHSGLPVVMTSLTTAGGLASFAAADIAPVANLGVLAPLGVLLALLYTLTLLPALLVLVPLRPASRGARASSRAIDRLLVRAGEISTRHPHRVLAATLVVLLLGVGGALRLRFAHHIVENLPEDDPHRAALELVDRKFEGTSTIEVMVDTGIENGLYEPETLNRIEAAVARVEHLAREPLRVGKAVSIVDLVKEIHQALNEDRASYYVVPQDRRVVAQELLLFENSGSDDLRDFADPELRRARISFRVPWVDGVYYPPFLETVQQALRETLGDQLRFEVTGSTALYARTFLALIASLARSYALALLIVTPLMILLIGRLGRGLLSMIPNLIPVVLTLGFMGWVGISLNFSTLLVGSIIIGLAVDDTIHFMHQFSRRYDATGDVAAAVRETLATTGSAMFVTSVVLTLSFGIFVFGTITGTVTFGILTAFATIVAFLADVLVAPALLAVALGSPKGAG
jgi:predicted RND superfamily exporter protein